MTQYRGAGRGDSFAGAAIVVHRHALEKEHRGRRRHGQRAVRAFHPPAAERQRCAAPFARAERFDEPGRAHHVGNGVPSSEFVESDRLGGHPVDP